MRGRAARSSCSCSTTSRGLGVSDLRPSKLTEPDPERDFGDWRRGGSGRRLMAAPLQAQPPLWSWLASIAPTIARPIL